jgi:hypothetical protein
MVEVGRKVRWVAVAVAWVAAAAALLCLALPGSLSSARVAAADQLRALVAPPAALAVATELPTGVDRAPAKR